MAHPGERRIQERLGDPHVVESLAALPGADFTTLLLAVMRARASRVVPSDVLRAYRSSRFARPSPIDIKALRAVEDMFLSGLPSGWEAIALSPVVPFGTHAAMADVSPDRVVPTIRSTEVAADPTTALAIEAADRRSATSNGAVRLATVQRVVRGQSYGGAAPSHFPLFALVTAGRDVGQHRFESQALLEHLWIHVAGMRAAGVRRMTIVLTDLNDGDREPALRGVEDAFEMDAGVDVVRDASRDADRYYTGVCFKVRAAFDEHDFEVSDGGSTRWIARLLSDRREHLFISASGLNPLAEYLARARSDA